MNESDRKVNCIMIIFINRSAKSVMVKSVDVLYTLLLDVESNFLSTARRNLKI